MSMAQSNGSLTRRVRSSAAWYMGMRVGTVILSTGTIVVVARLLRPEDYGLMAIVSVALLVGEVFSRTGFDAALIARKGPVDEYLSSMWSAELLRGVLQFLLLVLAAYPVAWFYRQSQLTLLLLVAGLAPLLRGLRSAGVTLLYKDLAFQKVALNEALPNAIGALVTILLAYAWRNVWALLVGQLVSVLTSVVASYIIAWVPPRFVFRPGHWLELWKYGQWEMVGAVFYVLFHNGDDLFIGRVLGIQPLGLYRMAYRVGNMPTTEGVNAMRIVLFPAFAQIQDDVARLRQAFLKFWEISSIIGLAFLSTCFLAAGPLVQVILGSKWLPIVPALRILLVWGGVEVLTTAVSSLFRAVNRPDWWAKTLIIRVVVLAVLIYPLSTRWGIAGTSCAALISAITNLPPMFRWISNSISCSTLDLLRPLLLPFAATAGALVTGLFADHFLNGMMMLTQLIGLITASGIGFCLVLLCGDGVFKTGLRARLLRAATS